MAHKTDGNADFICYNRAETGDCKKAPDGKGGTIPWDDIIAYVTRPTQKPKPGNEKCRCGKNVKHCKIHSPKAKRKR